MRQIDITKVERADLIDIRDVKTNNSQKQDGKVKDFIRQVKKQAFHRAMANRAVSVNRLQES